MLKKDSKFYLLIPKHIVVNSRGWGILCNWTSRQTKLLIMINKVASTKVVKCMAPESGVVASGVLV